MLFVTREMVGPVFFSLALLARGLMAAAITHWVCIGVAALMGDHPDDVIPTTVLVVVLVVLTVVASIASIRRSQPGGKERMVTQWRAFVLTVGAASEFGGLLMYVTGNLQAGSWAMGIGTAMVFCEIAAICGAAVIAKDSISPTAD